MSREPPCPVMNPRAPFLPRSPAPHPRQNLVMFSTYFSIFANPLKSYLYSFSPSENGPRSTFCLQVTRGQGWVVLRKETVHLVTSCAVHSNSAEEEEVRCKSYVEIIQVSKKATARHLWTHEGHENYTFPEL